MVCSECCKQMGSWADQYHSHSSLIAEIASGKVQLLSPGLQVEVRPMSEGGQMVL